MSPAGERHPDFEEGNTLSLQHGANSPRTIAARAAEVHGELLEVAPWLTGTHFAPAVARYLAAAAREELLDEHIRRLSAEKGAGAVPAKVWEQVTAAARLAAKLGQDLGLDPIGHARLKAVAAAGEIATRSLADLAATGAEIIARREAQIATESPLDGPESDPSADDEGMEP